MNGITDEVARQGFRLLLNLVEDQAQELRAVRDENQRLRDEIARLKGTPRRPPLPPPPSAPPPTLSSEAERHTPQPHTKAPKRDRIVVDRQELLRVDPATLPPDAVFKGYEEVVVQDLVCHTDNICFRKEVFYSPREQRSIRAPLPPGYAGEFGPGLKALSLVLYYGGLMSEPKIAEFLSNVGIIIAQGQVATLLIHGQEGFHAEKDAVYAAGLRSSPWHGTDDTATTVDGELQHCHIVSNPLYTLYQTHPAKDRLTIVDVLCNGAPRQFLLNDAALEYLAQLGGSRKLRARLGSLPRDAVLGEAVVDEWLAEQEPPLGPQQGRWVKDRLAIAAYRAQDDWPVVELLLSDAARQSGGVTAEHALCWVHEGRHYKKLVPLLAAHQELLTGFLGEFWAYYRELRAYQEAPTAAEQACLAGEFDRLFSRVTGYGALDERIAKTRAKKAALLAVLTHPEVPLHNNDCELGARGRVRKRDVSFGPRTAAGVAAGDTFQSLVATTTKLGVSFYEYVQDRVRGTRVIPPLAEVLEIRAQDRDLGASWRTPENPVLLY